LSYAQVSPFFFFFTVFASFPATSHQSVHRFPTTTRTASTPKKNSNAYHAARTQDQIQARLAQVQVSDGFRPYTKQEFADYFVSVHAAVQRVEDDDRLVLMLLVTFLVCFFSCVFQMYVGCTKHSDGDPAFFAELCRWALTRKNKLGRPLFTVQRKDAVPITRWEHLVELGFTVR
jgi:hypothetical protein